MDDSLKKIFSAIKFETSPGLEHRIYQKILAREKRFSILKFRVFSVIGVFSLVGMVPAFKLLISDLSHSGFYQYSSLAFSDSAIVLQNWREFVFSLAESLPGSSIILSFILFFVFFLSFKYVLEQIITNLAPLGTKLNFGR